MNALATWTKDIGHRVGIYAPGGSGDLLEAYRTCTLLPTKEGGVCCLGWVGMAGKLVTKIGGSVSGESPELFNWLHAIAIDSKGDFYAAEVSFCECGKHQTPHAREMASLRKWKLR